VCAGCKFVNIYRHYGEDCLVVKKDWKYKPNLNFQFDKIKFRSVKDYINFVETGNLGFRTIGTRGDQYKTVFGPSFANSGVIYRDSTVNLYKAHSRLTAMRFPLIDGKDEEMDRNQASCCDDNLFSDVFTSWVTHVIVHCADEFQRFPDSVVARMDYCDQPHTKRAMRVHEFNQLVESGNISYGLFTTQALGKNKVIEFARNNKYPRLVNDMSTPGSLCAGFIVESVKHGMECPFHHAIGGTSLKTVFASSPCIPALIPLFEELINPKSSIFFVYYSDDSCVSIVCHDGVFRANVDISSCDTSNGPFVFKTLEKLAAPFGNISHHMVNAVKQCELPLVLRNPANLKEKVTIKTKRPIEYSGSVLTTPLNNVANQMIATSILCHLSRVPPEERCIARMETLIIDAAYCVGYTVTIGVCKKVQELQFLKHSPFYTESGLTCALNFGVILRSLGQCDGDLPGSSKVSIVDRSEWFNAALMQSFAKSGNHRLLRALLKRFNRTEHPLSFRMKELYSKTTGESFGSISDGELALRYGLEAWEINQLEEYILKSTVGCRIFCTAVDKVMARDYDLAF